MINNVEFCPIPFEELEIHITGEVYTCCPNWNKFYSIGNIYKQSLEEIWNSDRAIELRKRLLNKDYSLCDKNCCPQVCLNNYKTKFKTEYKEKMEEFPKSIKFVYDKECNIACKICRKEVKRNSDEKLEILNSKIDNFFLPMLQHSEKLIINAAGDPFASRHSRLLIKKAAQKYPNLKFDFHTNGILCDENNLKNLNITPDKIDKIRIPIHAATAKTYAKIVSHGEMYFPQIIKNLEYLSKLKKEYHFEIYIHFVVTADNYKEIPAFLELAERLDVSPRFWEFRQSCCSYPMEENIEITNETHPLHNELVEIMNLPIVKSYKHFFTPILSNLVKEEKE